MAAPLTKTTAQGVAYARPPDVEAQIDEAVMLSPAELRNRLLLNERDAGVLRAETLVHLLRRGIATSSMEMFNAVLPVLLKRCERILRQKISDSKFPTAEASREDILGEFSELLASNGQGDIPDELDFYECRFNRAFRAFYVDRVNQEVAHLDRFAAVESIEELDEALGDRGLLKDIAISLHDCETPEARLRMQQLLEAIDALPTKDRNAVTLVHILGFKEESEDPDEETAATKCKCTGRTIRNRLASAEAKLARFQEDQ